MTEYSELSDFYRRYGEASFREDEPIYADICQGIADNRELLALLAAHPREEQQPNLIFAAVHYLLLGGLDHELAAIYAGRGSGFGRGAGAAAAAFADLVLSHRSRIDELLHTRRTQTNEVGRCAVLAVLLNHAQASTGQPIAWIDVGTSAGLNLQVDHFRIDYSIDAGHVWTGAVDAPLVLSSEVREGSPVLRGQHADIAWRLGIDRAPVDVIDPDQGRWLYACLWPSNTERAERTRVAIEVARAHPPVIVKADAVDGLASALSLVPAGLCTVVTTTWVWYYLPRQAQRQVLDTMREHHQRVFWYSIEGAGVVAELGATRDRHAVESVIGLVQVGGARPDQAGVLGVSHPHGAWFTWR